ncbi:putative N-acetylmannosaminyltransferase [Roseovarius sp. A-2]|uniref:WecB/TagA/CpsF family glycosyltransferase n=1 Tax=Roseovarius sp. A-2 TaxID=1570360 RepID=UPI0009B56615|nr:WecB/TagA/CpsF family glycosyltransferase [Roseovarius sp. A-2]GAW36143.1 putative N-acetylmannosaminyltransferase [Roseovarius sp. A-2]
MDFRIHDRTLRIAPPTRTALLAEISDRLRAGRGFALATLNLDHLVKLPRDQEFLDAYARHDLVVADGNPVVWLSRLAKAPVELMPGSDLIEPLARLAAESGTPLALVGSTEAALNGAEDGLRARVPDLKIAVRIAPPMGFAPLGDQGAEVIETLEASGAGLCFLALGAPKQEVFAARAHAALPHIGFASIGAGLDFIAGRQRRAPLWVRRIAMEWLWRLLSNPRRMTLRYSRCALILPGLAWRAWRQGAHRP